MSDFAIARQTYYLPPELKEQTEPEQHHQRALLALDHVVGIARLLQCVQCDPSDPPELLRRRAENLSEGIRTVGELLAVVCDSVFASLDQSGPED